MYNKLINFIDENCPDLSGIPDFLLLLFVFGYGYHHISGSLNFIKIILQIVLVRPFSSVI